jgi:4-alpha-glucanotransferase
MSIANEKYQSDMKEGPMPDKIKFIMILHNHQPVGNFDWVFRNAAEDAYIPFLDVLERHPGIKSGIHTTGPLLEFFAEHRPDYLDRVRSLVDAGRLEVLGGAFYEPIVSVLPDADKRGQFDMMNEWLETRFGRRPTGCWLAERIWEPGLASVTGNAGIAYTALDNTHFQSAGLDDNDIWGSYVTDDQGMPLRVLPIDYHLRYLIPFHDPQETIDYLGSLRERGVKAVTYADDGEKFGVWPGTKEWVFGKGWLERFFSLLEQHSSWIDIVFAGDYVRETPPLGRVYLPTASYKEMMEWALPVSAQKRIEEGLHSFEGDSRLDSLRPFIRGGFWRNFLAKYPESDTMYRRMLLTSARVAAAGKKKAASDARRELYQAQCNCGYWHGVFGGLYLNFLRRAIYEHLIKAERLLAGSNPTVEIRDLNGDGYEEVLLENGTLSCFISPRKGGAAYELDFIPKAFNLMDTFTRREEAYHSRIEVSDGEGDEHASIHDHIRVKSADVLKYLVYDWYRRLGFIDHFLDQSETFDRFQAVTFRELGDFVNQPYSVTGTSTKGGPQVTLERSGYLRFEGEPVFATVQKTIALTGGGGLTTTYRVAADGPAYLFGVEINLGLQSGYSDDSYIELPGRVLADRRLASSGEECKVAEINLVVGWMPLKVALKFSQPATLWRLPIETVSLSEGGVEHNYQNTCLVPLWRIPAGTKEFTVTIEMAVE